VFWILKTALPIFIDVFMDQDGTATSLAPDVRNILIRRFPASPL
jgi:hypothetical protein